MGALPDREPLVGAQPSKSPDQAPPLFAVPGRPIAAPAPRPEPVAPPAPEPEPAPGSAVDPQDQQEVAHEQEEPSGERLRAWFQGHMEGLDVWSKPIPPLGQIWEKALKGDHLPASPVWRLGEIARLVVSLPLSAAAYLLAFSLVSAPRTVGLCVVAIAAWTVASTLVSAVVELL